MDKGAQVGNWHTVVVFLGAGDRCLSWSRGEMFEVGLLVLAR